MSASSFGAAVRDEWDLDRRVVHLNHGSYGAPPRAVTAVRRRFLAEAEANPNRWFRFTLGDHFEAARAAAAAYVDAPVERFAFVPNTTAGVNAALSSLRIAPGDEVVVTDHVYPAVLVAARRVCERAGGRLVVADVGTDRDAAVERIEAALTDRSVAAVIDHIASPTGMVLPIADVVRALRARGVVTIVDAAHAPGQVRVSTEDVAADVWIGNFHKWSCAPSGAAALVVSDEWRDRISPLVASLYAGDRFPDSFGWVGTLDYTPFLCVPAAIEFHRRLGDELMPYCFDLAETGRRLFGADPVVPAGAAGAMTIVPLPDGVATTLDDARALIRRAEDELDAELCFLPWRDRGYLRLSAFAYNTHDDYERVAERLPAFFGKPGRHMRESASPNVVIREATADDADAIGALYRQWWDEIDHDPHAHPGPSRLLGPDDAPTPGSGHPMDWQGVTYTLVPDRDATVGRNGPYHLVAETDGDVVGVLYGVEGEVDAERWEVFPRGGRYVELSDLFVSVRWRAHGVGAALVERFLAAAAGRGHTQTHVRSEMHNVAFYARFGFSAYTVFQYRDAEREIPAP